MSYYLIDEEILDDLRRSITEQHSMMLNKTDPGIIGELLRCAEKTRLIPGLDFGKKKPFLLMVLDCVALVALSQTSHPTDALIRLADKINKSTYVVEVGTSHIAAAFDQTELRMLRAALLGKQGSDVDENLMPQSAKERAVFEQIGRRAHLELHKVLDNNIGYFERWRKENCITELIPLMLEEIKGHVEQNTTLKAELIQRDFIDARYGANESRTYHGRLKYPIGSVVRARINTLTRLSVWRYFEPGADGASVGPQPDVLCRWFNTQKVLQEAWFRFEDLTLLEPPPSWAGETPKNESQNSASDTKVGRKPAHDNEDDHED